jgi:uncharacterized protein YrrD
MGDRRVLGALATSTWSRKPGPNSQAISIVRKPLGDMDAMRLDLDSPVTCAGEPYGELADVVIDPSTRRVTHLVVEPHDRHHLARLVPVERAQARGAADAPISLDCTIAEVGQLEPVQKSAYLRLGELPVEGEDWDVGIEETFALPPSQSLGVSALGAGVEPLDYDPHATVSYDRVPKGKVEIRRKSAVTSSDGDHLGHVDGFVVDDEHQIAYLVMEHGHLWGKREVAIPTGAIARMETDEVVLSLSRDEAGALEPLRRHRREG